MAIYNPDTDYNNTKVSIGATSTTISPINRNRKNLILTNDSDETIYVSLGKTAIINQGIRLNANGGNTVIDGTYTGIVTAICASGSKNLTKSEG